MLDIAEARKQADDYMRENGAGSYAMRSCWNCNSAHEHLKDADYPILCGFGCGHWYFKGVDITESSDNS